MPVKQLRLKVFEERQLNANLRCMGSHGISESDAADKGSESVGIFLSDKAEFQSEAIQVISVDGPCFTFDRASEVDIAEAARQEEIDLSCAE
jgi:hypothetical protein